MAFSVNHVVLVGNVSNDPQLTYTPKGTALLKLSLATNHSRKTDSGDWEDIPSFHRITIWAKTAEYLGDKVSKGDKLYVDGRIEYGSYEKDGVTRYTSDIIANTVIPMNTRVGGVNANAGNSPAPAAAGPSMGNFQAKSSPSAPVAPKSQEEVSVDDIPF